MATFIITGNSKELLENEVKPLVREFLAERGLTLSEEKTKVTHIMEGFDFLGQNIRKYRYGKLCGIVGPKPESVNGFIQLGYDFVAIASDMGMMMRQANAFIEAVKPNLTRGYSSTVY